MHQVEDERDFLRSEIDRYRSEVADMQAYLRESVVLLFFLSFAMALVVGGDVFSGRFAVFGIRVAGASVGAGLFFWYLVTLLVGLAASDAGVKRRGQLIYTYVFSFALSLISTPAIFHILEQSVRIG